MAAMNGDQAFEELRKAHVPVRRVIRVFEPDAGHPDTEVLFLGREDAATETLGGEALTALLGPGHEPLITVGW